MNETHRNRNHDPDRLAARLEELTGWCPRRAVQVLTDTTEIMKIHRGHVIELEGRLYAILGHCYESRFGISDQPKYWVLRAIDLDGGRDKIVKTVFHEDFVVRIGPLRIRCYRSPEKESEVLELIRGKMLNLLHRLIESIEGIHSLHEAGLCHGDIRNDHIIIDRQTDRFRWIDFDLKQDFSDFDIWSIGNVLAYIVGQGIKSFHQVLRSEEYPDAVTQSLGAEDASAFYDYRIINLRKLFPYVPASVNEVLMRFSVGSTLYYESLAQVAEDLGNALDRV